MTAGSPDSRVLLIEACDFETYPVGGQLTTARQLVASFGDRLALVGESVERDRVGRWTRRMIGGRELDFFSIGCIDPAQRKPWIPRRLSTYLRLHRYRKRILAYGASSAYTMAPEVLLAVQHWGLRLAYNFCGVENPLDMPRYAFGRWLARPFERRVFVALARHCELIVAAANREAIQSMRSRSKGLLEHRRIVFFPSMVDAGVFHLNRMTAPGPDPLLVTCGRLNRVKGWDLILDAFVHVRRSLPNARLVFVGDGEDRSKIEGRIHDAGLTDAVSITGFRSQHQVADILNSADLFLMGSHREGWPTALVEAEACGLPAVTTLVSGVTDLIVPGVNGVIVRNRSAQEFAEAILAALALERPNQTSVRIGQRYSVQEQMQILRREWEPLRHP